MSQKITYSLSDKSKTRATWRRKITGPVCGQPNRRRECDYSWEPDIYGFGV